MGVVGGEAEAEVGRGEAGRVISGEGTTAQPWRA